MSLRVALRAAKQSHNFKIDYDEIATPATAARNDIL